MLSNRYLPLLFVILPPPPFLRVRSRLRLSALLVLCILRVTVQAELQLRKGASFCATRCPIVNLVGSAHPSAEAGRCQTGAETFLGGGGGGLPGGVTAALPLPVWIRTANVPCFCSLSASRVSGSSAVRPCDFCRRWQQSGQ